MINKLNKQEIQKYLKYNIEIITVDETNSTNDDLKKLAQEGKNTPVLLCANKQLKGRGRQGNSFYSPDNGIYMSLLFFPDCEVNKNSFITTLAACSVSSTIEKITGIKTKIKWVNDIYTDNGKVCGILTESSYGTEKDNINYSVLGIGINLFPPKNGFPDELKGIASAVIEDENFNIDVKNRLIAEIINNFIDSFSNFDIEAHIKEYKSKMMLIGKEILYKKNNLEFTGVVTDIDNNLNLVVRNSFDVIDTLSSGEIKIKSWK